MAVPTITSIDPTGGTTRGRNVVKITGTNFSLAPDPPADPFGAAFQSVKVMFGTLQSPAAYAVNDTLVIATVPTYEGDSMGGAGDPVQLELSNLDGNGDVIPGEVVTHDSYTYNRPSFTDEQVLEYILRRFVEYLRRHITPNVRLTMSRSYSEGDDQLNERIKQAELPMVWINGVDLEPDDLAQKMTDQEYMDGDFDFNEYRVPTSVRVTAPSIQIYSRAEHSRELFALSQAFLNALRDVPKLVCAPPSYDTEASEYKYPMSIPAEAYPSFDLGPENDGLKICTVGCVIEEVDLTDLAGTLTDIGWTVEQDIEIDFSATP